MAVGGILHEEGLLLQICWSFEACSIYTTPLVSLGQMALPYGSVLCCPKCSSHIVSSKSSSSPKSKQQGRDHDSCWDSSLQLRGSSGLPAGWLPRLPYPEHEGCKLRPNIPSFLPPLFIHTQPQKLFSHQRRIYPLILRSMWSKKKKNWRKHPADVREREMWRTDAVTCFCPILSFKNTYNMNN